MLETVLAYLVPVLAALLLSALTYLTRTLYNYIKEKSKSAIVLAANEVLNIAVQETVDALDQELVNGLKEASADGKLTKAEIEMVKNDAITRVKAKVGDNILKLLGEYFDNVTQLIVDKIESYLDAKRTEAMRFFGQYLGGGEG